MHRKFKILLCVLSAIGIGIAGSVEWADEVLKTSDIGSYFFVALMLMSIVFTQNQLYNYIVPKRVKEAHANSPKKYYRKSFFNGCVGAGYFSIILHIVAMYSDTLNNTSYLYIGLVLIFLGTISKIKEVLEYEFREEVAEGSVQIQISIARETNPDVL